MTINRSSSGPIRPVYIVISNGAVIVIVNGGQHPTPDPMPGLTLVSAIPEICPPGEGMVRLD
jgi:hypothetical protein